MGLNVTIKSEEVVAEMQPTDEPTLGVIAEMVSDPVKLDGYIPGLSSRGRAIAEANSDESPEFPIVRVEEGWSNNGRLWDAAELMNIAEQVNRLEPVGHWGHIKPENLSWEAPEPQTTWLGAITRDEPSKQQDRLGKIVKVFYAAGYNLPGARIRTYIKSKAVRGVSWLGSGKQIPVPGRGVQMRDFRLMALDWSRKLAEGMPSTGIVGVASEQTKGVTNVADKPLSQVTPEEFKNENPLGYTLLRKEVEDEQEDVIAEMKGEVDSGKATVTLLAKLREALGIDENADILDTVKNLKTSSAETIRSTFEGLLDSVLATKIVGDTDEVKKARRLARRLILTPLTVSEMGGFEDEDAVSEMVDERLDNDEDLQDVVSEQTAGQNVSSVRHMRGGNGKKADGTASGNFRRQTVQF